MKVRAPITVGRAATLVAIAALGAGLAGCADDPSEAAGAVSSSADTVPDRGTLTVYSGRHYGIEVAFEQFEEETGINVEFLTGNDVELRERIAAEGDETAADVYLTVDAGNLWAAAEEGVFQPLESIVLDEAIPADVRDAENRWFGLALRMRTIVYNTELIDRADVPTTYAALAEPEWEGRVCMRDAANGYNQSLVASIIAAEGEERALEIVEGWAANAEIFANDVGLIRDMAAGACEVGIVNHYYLARELAENSDLPVALVWAEQDGRGVHTNISGGGVTAHADDVELGQRFLEWLATDGQDTLVADNHEYPANPSVDPEPLIAEEFGTDFVRDRLRADELGSLNAAAIELMDEADFG